jgi:8-oxo-dGTP diphosphatase
VNSPLVVVGAAVLDRGRLLAAQRREPPALAGSWELPGGKVERGESDEAALIREVAEEIDVQVSLCRRVGGDWPLWPGAVLRVWTARIVAGTPTAGSDHLAVRWLAPGRWHDVAWLAPDLPVLEALRPLATEPPGVAGPVCGRP